MNFLHRSLGNLYSPRRRQAANMDPTVRQSLFDAVSQETAAGADELREVQSELVQLKEQLNVTEEKEQFLGMRTRQYRKALDEQIVRLQAERDGLIAARKKIGGEGVHDDSLDEEAMDREEIIMSAEELEEAEAALERRMEKWEADEDALASIIETHKHILASCENMRRSIHLLQDKEKQILKLRGDCEEFLETAAELVNEEDSPEITNERSEAPNEQTADGESNSSQNNASNPDPEAAEDSDLEDVAV